MITCDRCNQKIEGIGDFLIKIVVETNRSESIFGEKNDLCWDCVVILNERISSFFEEITKGGK